MIELYHNDCHRAAGTLEKLQNIMEELGIGSHELQIIHTDGNKDSEILPMPCCPAILINGLDIVTGQKPDSGKKCNIHDFGGESCVTVPGEYIRLVLSGYHEV